MENKRKEKKKLLIMIMEFFILLFRLWAKNSVLLLRTIWFRFLFFVLIRVFRRSRTIRTFSFIDSFSHALWFDIFAFTAIDFLCECRILHTFFDTLKLSYSMTMTMHFIIYILLLSINDWLIVVSSYHYYCDHAEWDIIIVSK